MIKIGLTGGIGSGKTLVSKIFSLLGVPVYNSDERAKWIINNSEEIKYQLVQLFGEETYLNGKYNTSFVASKVFKNKPFLEKLNSIVHPKVAEDFNQFCSNYKSAKFILKEAAILFESGAYKEMDKVISVVAPIELRLKRVVDRDATNNEEVLKRIENQLSDEERILRSDYVITNDEKSLLIEQILKINSELGNH